MTISNIRFGKKLADGRRGAVSTINLRAVYLRLFKCGK